MKGKHLVIGLVLFVIVVVAAIYFTMTATFKKDIQGAGPVLPVIEVLEGKSWAE
jgi:hypothetical protein